MPCEDCLTCKTTDEQDGIQYCKVEGHCLTCSRYKMFNYCNLYCNGQKFVE